MFIFLHIPKTGGTSFRFILENSFGSAHCHTGHTRTARLNQDDLAFIRKIFPRLCSIAGHNLVEPARLGIPDAFLATFLREPVARVISHYQDSVIRGGYRGSFAEWLRDREHLNNLQVRMIAGEPDLEKARSFIGRYHFVGLTEKFDLSLHLLDRACPYKLNLRYHKYVVRKDDQIKRALERDPEMIELARQHNRLDLELYSFVERELFPSLCRRVGLDPGDAIPKYGTYSHSWKWKYKWGRFYNRGFRIIYSLRRKGGSLDEERTETTPASPTSLADGRHLP